MTVNLSKIVWHSSAIFVSVLTFLVFTKILNNTMDATTAFTGLALFNTLRSPLQMFPEIIVRIQEALVSLRRIESFLKEKNLSRFMVDDSVETDMDQVGLGLAPNTKFLRGSQGTGSRELASPIFAPNLTRIKFPEVSFYYYCVASIDSD